MDILSQLVSAFIGVTERFLQRKTQNRKRCAKVLNDMYTALTECHKAYLQYANHPKRQEEIAARCYRGPGWDAKLDIANRLHEELSPLRREWTSAITRLARVIWNQRKLLQIWDKELYDKLCRYTAGEVEEHTDEGIPEDTRVTNLSRWFSSYTLCETDGTITFENDFETARGSLTEFIRRHTELSDFF